MSLNLQYAIIKIILCFGLIFLLSFPLSSVYAQNFNVASVYDINDAEVESGDIIISDGENGLVRTNITYNSKIFGVLNDLPTLVLRPEATTSGRPIIRQGDTVVNVTDFNGEIKKGDFVTTSSVLGKGMRAGQSGYVVGIATEDAIYTDQVIQVEGKNTRLGTVKTALKIEYAEITTARNTFRLLNDLNAALFRNIQNPEKFTLTIRYIVAGLIALIAFTLGFFTISRTITKGVEAMGRNPLARNSIMASVIFQVIATSVGALVALAIIYIIVRI